MSNHAAVFDAEPPPVYDADAAAPEYGSDVDSPSNSPLQQWKAYMLRRFSRNHFEFTPANFTTKSAFPIRTQYLLRLPGSRPSLVMSSYEPQAGDAAAGPCSEVATARFFSSDSFPWSPRAAVKHGVKEYSMAFDARREWAFDFDGCHFFWKRQIHPMRIELYENLSPAELDTGPFAVRATLTFTARGTRAANGAAVGTMKIPYREQAPTRETVEVILWSLAVCFVHWRDQGKIMFNPTSSS